MSTSKVKILILYLDIFILSSQDEYVGNIKKKISETYNSGTIDVVLAFLISILKIFKSLQTIGTGLQISQASENVWKVL